MLKCRECGAEFPRPSGRGRPPVKCEACRKAPKAQSEPRVVVDDTIMVTNWKGQVQWFEPEPWTYKETERIAGFRVVSGEIQTHVGMVYRIGETFSAYANGAPVVKGVPSVEEIKNTIMEIFDLEKTSTPP